MMKTTGPIHRPDNTSLEINFVPANQITSCTSGPFNGGFYDFISIFFFVFQMNACEKGSVFLILKIQTRLISKGLKNHLTVIIIILSKMKEFEDFFFFSSLQRIPLMPTSY